MASMTPSISALSDRGLERETNEDAFLVADMIEPPHGKAGRTSVQLEVKTGPLLVAVADGMGGAAAGELASELALKSLSQTVAEADGDGRTPTEPAARVAWLVAAVGEANRRVLSVSRDEPSAHGMGTTLTAAILDEGSCALVHVGDSRAYLLRDERLTQLTIDQTYVQSEVAKGSLTPEQAKTHRQRNQLLEVLGVNEAPGIDRFCLSLHAGDRLLMCTDGLYDLVEDSELLGVVAVDTSPMAQAKTLIALARKRGGFDNITVVLAHI